MTKIHPEAQTIKIKFAHLGRNHLYCIEFKKLEK